ncbi:MAG: hypothetical protein IJ342_00635 [Muribaculaceae bacterium]|nr:hypothetical protein [Muribaculaceae bacterium]
MTDHERPNIKSIRIKKSVYDRLDARKRPDDSYTDVIQAVLDDNERLTAKCEELQKDKDDLFEILKGLNQGVEQIPYALDEPKRENPQRNIEYLKTLQDSRKTTS